MLSDAVEALFGALFIDCKRNYQLVKRLVLRHWSQAGLIRHEAIESSDSDIDVQDEDGVYLEQANRQALAQTQEDEQLIDAVYYGQVERTTDLLARGANANIVQKTRDEMNDYLSDLYTISVLQLAVCNLRQTTYQIVELLLKHHANPNWNGGVTYCTNTPGGNRSVDLFEAINRKKTGTSPQKFYDKKTALHCLVSNEVDSQQDVQLIIRLINLLLTYNANPDLRDAYGQTALDIVNGTLQRLQRQPGWNQEKIAYLSQIHELLNRHTNVAARQASAAATADAAGAERAAFKATLGLK